MAQISNDEPPGSPDDEDELERRSQLKLSYSTSPLTSPSSGPVQRLCLWQNHITQAFEDDPSNSNEKSSMSNIISRLNTLNLSYNRFQTLPAMLSCLSPHLTSLNLSHNLLTDPSTICSYPAKIKTLDLSSNSLRQSIYVESKNEKSSRRHRISPTSICFRPEPKENSSQIDPVKRRRSRSVSRHKVLASSSLTVTNSSSTTSESCCIHRRHLKLEYLHDLNLSENEIDQMILTVNL